jgi:hypothetical protein
MAKKQEYNPFVKMVVAIVAVIAGLLIILACLRFLSAFHV